MGKGKGGPSEAGRWRHITRPEGLGTGTFGSHYRTKGQGARKQSESGSEVPDSPTGAVVNLHISTQEGTSQSCLPTSCFANNNILPGTQLVKTSVLARAVADENNVFSGAKLIALEKLELLACDFREISSKYSRSLYTIIIFFFFTNLFL